MSIPILRPYQEHDAEQLRVGFKQFNAGILCQPTGSGKGTLSAWMVHRVTSSGRRVLFTVYGQPLVEDQYERVTSLGVEAGMIMGSGKSSTRKPWLPAQVASISTLHKREHLPKADLVIVDECQDSTSRTYRKVLDRYVKMGAKVLGLSGTPVGPGGVGLGRKAGGIFDFMVVGPSVKELIRDKYLVSCRLYSFDCDSLKGVKKKGDDYDQSALSALAAANADRVGDIVGNWKQYSPDRKTVSFGVDKADATRIKEQFSIEGINAVTVFDDTNSEERKRIWLDYDRGDLRVISSVNVIGRGWDHSIAKCVIDASATLSVQKALQRWGRCSRPHRGYDDFILLDMSGNYYRHGRYEADRNWNLEGEPIKATGDGLPDYRIKKCPKCRFPFRLGPRQCPRCGLIIPLKEREVMEANGHLKLIDIEEERKEQREREQKEQKQEAVDIWASRATDEEKMKKLDQWKKQAREKGWSSRWAYQVFKRTFGHDVGKVVAPPPPEMRRILNDWNNL